MRAKDWSGPWHRFRARTRILFVIACFGLNSLALAQAPERRFSPIEPPTTESSDANPRAPERAEPDESTEPPVLVDPEPHKPEADTSKPRVSDATTKLLMKAMGCEDSPVQLYGWIQNSFSGNTNGTPLGLSNVSVFPNRLANQWQGNQYYAVLENVIEQSDDINLGFRIDTLFGNDWEFTRDIGFFNNTFKTNSFVGLDFPQIYGEIHLPFLAQNGMDLKGGRFYSPAGFESPMAIYRPALSVSNIFYNTVFTYFGALATAHLSERLDIFYGQVNGPNRWIDTSYVWNSLVGLKWNSADGRTTILDYFRVGPDQLPYFPPADTQFPVPGFPPPPYMAGKRNVGYTHRPRYYNSFMISHHWNDQLTEVFESDFVIDVDSPGFGVDGTPQTTSVYGFVHWLLYDFNPQVTGFWRSELFGDPYGAATGLADTYYEITLGCRYKPKQWLWIRPEARYDWVQTGHPYSAGTRSSQLTLSFDVIFLW